jgi:type III secretion protein T
MSYDIYYQQIFYVFLLGFIRNLSMVYFFYITVKLAKTLKTVLALVLTCITYNFTPIFLMSWQQFLVYGLTNALLGFIISFMLSLPFYLIEMNGSMVDNLRGETVASTISNSFIDHKSSFYNLLNIAFLTYFICSNGMYLFLKIVFLSYHTFSLNLTLPKVLLVNSVGIINHVLVWFCIISFPAICISMLIDLIFAFSAVVVPNLNTFFLGFPIKSMGILLLYFCLIPTLFYYMMNYFHTIIVHLGFNL